VLDATAQGAAFAAGQAAGVWQDYEELVQRREIDRVFAPENDAEQAQTRFFIWQKAVERAKHWEE